MYDNINKEELNKLLNDPNFMVSNVYGPKPSSREYKLGIGTWDVTGYYKSK